MANIQTRKIFWRVFFWHHKWLTRCKHLCKHSSGHICKSIFNVKQEHARERGFSATCRRLDNVRGSSKLRFYAVIANMGFCFWLQSMLTLLTPNFPAGISMVLAKILGIYDVQHIKKALESLKIPSGNNTGWIKMKEEDMAREAIAKHAKKGKAMVTEERFCK